MNDEEYQQAMYDELKGLEFDDKEDTDEEQSLTNQEIQDAYGHPEPEERHNQHTFISNSLHQPNPEKVTFMTQSELGTPLFNMRFLLDIEDICKYYLDEIAKDLQVDNKIAEYFREKVKNISDSGMSNDGFLQKLNVTKKMEATRERIRNLDPKMKGGRR